MWPHLLCTAIGAWLMAAPDLLDYRDPARTNDHIVGPLLFTFACTAAFQSTRGLRFVDLMLGIWLLIAPLVFGYWGEPLINSLACGLGVVVLSLIRGPITVQLGGGWPALWRTEPAERA